MSLKLHRIFPAPHFAASWEGEYEEKAAEWIELFLDLIVVAGCANVADSLEESVQEASEKGEGFPFQALGDFCLVFVSMVCSWYAFTMKGCRYTDTSMTTNLLSYLYFLGMAGFVMFSSGDPVSGTFVGLFIQRLALVGLFTVPFICLRTKEGARVAQHDLLFMGSTSLLLGCALAFGWVETHPRAVLCVLIALEVPVLYATMWRNVLDCQAVPVNVDHYTERVGNLVMVVLGESVVSAAFNAKQSASVEGLATSVSAAANTLMLPEGDLWSTYVTVGLSLLTSFAFAILYFYAVPPREMSAQRRSKFAAFVFVVTHYALFLALLLMGVGIKFVTGSFIKRGKMNKSQVAVLFVSQSVALCCMLLIRMSHFFGKLPSPQDPPNVQRIMWRWWYSLFVSPMLPILSLLALVAFADGDGGVDPIIAVSCASGSLFIYVSIEHLMTHRLHAEGHGTVRFEYEHRRPNSQLTLGREYGTMDSPSWAQQANASILE